MDNKVWDAFLSQLAGLAGIKPLSPELDSLCRALAVALREQSASDGTADVLPSLYLRIANHVRGLDSAPLQLSGLTPEILEWAKGMFSEEEAIAGLREIEETGGLTFEQLIQGLETSPAHE